MKSRLVGFGRRQRVGVLTVVLSVMPFVVLSEAGQAGTAASIIGQVRDESGGVLPGVAVTATSPALQVRDVTSVTDERGEYRLTPLPIGTYTGGVQHSDYESGPGSRRDGRDRRRSGHAHHLLRLPGRASRAPVRENDADQRSTRRSDVQELRNRRQQAALARVAVHGVVLGPQEERSLRQRGARLRSQRGDQCRQSHVEWQGKMSGAYLFPYGLLGSANFEHRSGTEWARSALFRGGRQIPSITLAVEPVGARRMPNINLLDLRLEKRVRLKEGRNLAVRMNIFNALNENTPTALTQVSGARFMVPTNIMLPRILELSASFTF